MKNTEKSTRALNDLIVGALLTKYKLNKNEGQKYLEIPINPNKVYLLQNYIDHHELQSLVKIDGANKAFYILPSLLLDYKLKDWTENGKVTAINPADLHIGCLLFWISLYAQKSEYSVIVETNLSEPLQDTLCYFFSRYIEDCDIVCAENRFHFKSFLELYLLSKSYRPYLESGEFYEMLSSKEYRKLKKIIAQEKQKGEVVF